MKDDPAAGLPRGVIPPSGRGGRFLSDVIVELGFADRETVEQALDASRAPGKKLGSTLVEMGILSEHQLGRAVAERYRLDYLDLEEFDVDPEATQVIGDKEMKSYEAAPVAFTEDGALVVAMVDPADWLAAEEIAQLTGRRVRRAVASAEGVAQVIARVAEARSSGGESTGDAAEDSAPAPTRLTLRRVANPLTGGAPPPSAEEPRADPPEDASATPAGEPEGTPAERPHLDTELDTTRAELADTRGKLTSALDAALERAADAERGLGEARADVSRLEAELAAARDQAESLRAEVSWARRQIEQHADREDRAIAELRERIEAMHAAAPAPAEPPEPEPESAEPISAAVPVGPSTPERPPIAAANGTEPPPATPPGTDGHSEPVPTPAVESGDTAEARGAKRLIAAARRL